MVLAQKVLRFLRKIIASVIWAMTTESASRDGAAPNSQKSPSSDLLDRLIAGKARRYGRNCLSRGYASSRGPQKTLETVAAPLATRNLLRHSRAEIEYSLLRLDRLDQITAIISAEDTTKCKPDPEGFQLALGCAAKQQCRKRHRRASTPFAALFVLRIVWLSNDSLAAGNCLGQRCRYVGRRCS